MRTLPFNATEISSLTVCQDTAGSGHRNSATSRDLALSQLLLITLLVPRKDRYTIPDLFPAHARNINNTRRRDAHEGDQPAQRRFRAR